MDTVEASLNIELILLCPNCDEFINLMDIEGLNDEGQLVQEACPSGCWGESHEKFKREIDCPDCKKKIHVSGIAW